MTSWVSLVVLLMSAVVAGAQEPPQVPLTMQQAIARAMEQSDRLAEMQARERGAQAAVRARDAADRPTLSITGGYTRTNHVDAFGVRQPNGDLRIIYPDIPDNFFTRAMLQWPIYSGGRHDALVRAASAEARAVAAEAAVTRADLRLEVVRAYWALVTARESVQVFEESLRRADAHLEEVRSRFDSGLIPPNDVSAVEAQRARQELQLIEARNLYRGVLEDLRRLTGLTEDVVPVEPLAASASPAAEVVSEPEPTAARDELRALDERVAAAEARIDAVTAGRRPMLSLTTAADYANPNPRIFPRQDAWRTSWEVGVAATWTLWDGGRITAEAGEAAAAVDALRARRNDLETLIATDIRQRQLDLESARAAVAAATAAIRSAEDTRRVVSERYNVGVATSTDVLDAHIALLQAELDRTRTLANIRLAEARLERARGR